MVLKTIFIILSIALLLILISLFFVYYNFQSQESVGGKMLSLKVNNTYINVEIADTAEERARGLSGRSSISEGDGMLFIFDKPAFHSFWMKEMNFPIDIIWIGEDYKIVDITKSVFPDSFPQTFQSQAPVKYVLEVSAGLSDRRNIKVGDNVENIDAGLNK